MSDIILNSDNRVGVYKSKDNFKNFKLKVTLSKATGGLFKDYYKDNADDLKKLTSALANEPSDNNREEKTISWQQKIFSKREFLKYGDENYEPESILERNYKDECLKLKEKRYHPGRIFTYIDSDSFEFCEEIDGDVNDLNDVPSYLHKSTSSLRKRRPLVSRNKTEDVVIPRNNLVNYSPKSQEDSIIKGVDYHKMYIMADLSSFKEGEIHKKENEFTICCIKVYSSGTILIKPDLNNEDRPYVVGVGSLRNGTFEYIIQNVSNQINIENLMRELKLKTELYSRHAEYVKNLVGNEFYIPEKNIFKVFVKGSIVSAKNFDYDDLHVYYRIDLPTNWYADPSQSLSGFTNTCRTICEGKDEIAYFSFPFEFDLYYKNDEINPKNRDILPQMPKIYFEVASYDSWSRYRVEGYSWLQIPTRPGRYDENLVNWRPRGDSFIYELRRFFIGGSPELEDITYSAIPSDHDGSVLSRFGFRTVTTGNLNVALNVLFQSQAYMNLFTRSNRPSSLADKLGNNSKLNDLVTVLDAFLEAKNRMQEARENSSKYLEQ